MKKLIFNTVLLDLDNTIFDYSTSEKLSFIKVMKNTVPFIFNLEELYPIFTKINKHYWDLYETGKIPQTGIVKNIFKEFFNTVHINDFNDDVDSIFLNYLASEPILIDNAFNFIKKLHAYTKILVITNGCDFVQRSRLKISNISQYIDGLYISEEIGYKKPEKEFFEYLLQKEQLQDKTKLIVLGDSMHSDINGAKTVGIKSCLFNPKRIKYEPPIYDYQIFSYDQFFDIILDPSIN